MSFLSMASRILTRYKALPTRISKKFGVISRMARYTEGAYMAIGGSRYKFDWPDIHSLC
jgi:hypothetical protein